MKGQIRADSYIHSILQRGEFTVVYGKLYVEML